MLVVMKQEMRFIWIKNNLSENLCLALFDNSPQLPYVEIPSYMYQQTLIFPSLKFHGNALRLPWLLVTCALIMQLYICKQNISMSRCNHQCQQ